MLTFPIKPIWAVNLNHPATRIASTDDGKTTAIASDGPLISVVFTAETQASSIHTIKLAEPVRELAIESDGKSLAVINASHKLQLLQLDLSSFGNKLSRCEEPVHDTCEFSRDGTKLWSVGLVSDVIAEIRLYDVPTLKLIASHRFKLPIGQCGFILTTHPQRDVIGLWACGGPDEVWNYWVNLTTTGIDVQHQKELDGSTPPCFNDRGDRFVVLNGYDLLSFSYPECSTLYEPVPSGEDDECWAERMRYLNSTGEDRVLATTDENRLFVVALETGEVLGEVHLEGHEPKPCYEVYRALQNEDGLCTDLHSFRAAGSNLVVSVHTNGRVSNRQDTVLCWATP